MMDLNVDRERDVRKDIDTCFQVLWLNLILERPWWEREKAALHAQLNVATVAQLEVVQSGPAVIDTSQKNECRASMWY